MHQISCDRCGCPRFWLYDQEDGTVNAKCQICDKEIKLKPAESPDA